MTADSGKSAAWLAAGEEWRCGRAHLKAHRQELTRRAAGLYPDLPKAGASSLLTRPEWLPERPIPLTEVKLAWSPDSPRPTVVGTEPEAAGVLPPGAVGDRPSSYSSAVRELDPPRIFENRPTYRLTEAKLDEDARMAFTAGAYFDVIDVGEAVAHELAAAALTGAGTTRADLPLRDLVGDPTDAARRPMPVAITTLTIRWDASQLDARFLVHWRDPAKVATNGGMYQVVPVGMFQPARVDTGGGNDFDLWRCMAREFNEELLGAAEHVDVDYDTWPFFLALEAARRDGGCRPYCLGLGVDPLTFAADILTVVVFEAATFDALFAGLVEHNDEGRILTRSPDGTCGLPFRASEVSRLVDVEPTQPAGAAVLSLAWHMRHALLL